MESVTYTQAHIDVIIDFCHEVHDGVQYVDEYDGVEVKRRVYDLLDLQPTLVSRRRRK